MIMLGRRDATKHMINCSQSLFVHFIANSCQGLYAGDDRVWWRKENRHHRTIYTYKRLSRLGFGMQLHITAH